MPVVVHGAAGMSLEASTWGGRDGARRGAYFERVVGDALGQWLDSRIVVTHLFHDVSDLARVAGSGMEPLPLGSMNIDHVVLTGSTWLLVDAKGVGEGVLRLVDGVGCLERKDGTYTAQPWMDDAKAYSRAGAVPDDEPKGRDARNRDSRPHGLRPLDHLGEVPGSRRLSRHTLADLERRP